MDNREREQDPPWRWKWTPKIFPSQSIRNNRKCPVSCFKEFVYRRPERAKSPESPFFLGIRHRRNPEDKIWFVNSPMGKNKIGQFLSSATKNLPMSTSGKFTNHSVRKTCIKTLLDSGVSHNNVAQLSSHKSLKSLDSYAVASREQQRQMSKILSGKENNSKPKPKPNAPKENIQAHSRSSNVQGSMPTSSLFSGASIGVLNIQNLALPALGFQLKSSSWHFGVFRRRRLEQNLACKFFTVDLFFFTVTLSCNKFRWHLPKWEHLIQFFVRIFVNNLWFRYTSQAYQVNSVKSWALWKCERNQAMLTRAASFHPKNENEKKVVIR